MSSPFEQIIWLLKRPIHSATDQVAYYYENPDEVVDDVKDWIKENKVTTAFITGGVLVVVVPAAIGFGSAGPVLGSIAAGWQSTIGNVVAGSVFATLQSWGMTGVFTGAGAGMIAAGSAWKVLRDVDWSVLFEPDALVTMLGGVGGIGGGSLTDILRRQIGGS